MNARARRKDEEFLDGWDSYVEAGTPFAKPPPTRLHPMPGDPAFDDDASFAAVPLFPSPDGPIITVGDIYWTFPRVWLRRLETRPPSKRRLRFRLRLPDGSWLSDHPRGKEFELAWKRAMYLEIFRAQKPRSFRTLRGRLETYGALIQCAIAAEKELKQLTLSDLARVASSLNRRMKGNLREIYRTLKWWKKQPGRSYTFFAPPDEATKRRYGGFDPIRIRANVPAQETKTWQAFPDPFVAAIGKLTLFLVEHVRPIVNACCRKLAQAQIRGQSLSKQDVRSILSSFQWPKGFEPAAMLSFRSLCFDCQTAGQILISLLLGPRAEEILSLPGICIRTGEGEIGAGVLRG